jgi:hypothetical protein
MAYADALRQAVFSTETCADLIEGVVKDPISIFSTSTESFTGSVDYHEKVASRITVTKTAEENVLLLGMILSSQSAGTAHSAIAAGSLFKDGTKITGAYSLGVMQGNSTGGRLDPFTIVFVDDSSDAGDIEYGIGAYLSNASNTLYIRDVTLTAIVFKKD